MIHFITPFAKRNFLIVLSAVLFIGLLFFSGIIMPGLNSSVQHLEFLAISVLIMIGLVVMFFWASMGVLGGLTSFIAAMVFFYRPLTSLNPYYYNVLVMAFFLSSLIGYLVHKKIYTSTQDYKVKMERIREDTNLIRNHLKNRDAEIKAMGRKIEGLLKLKNISDSLNLSLNDSEIMRVITEETYNIFGGDSRVMLFMVGQKAGDINLAYTSKPKDRMPCIVKNGSIYDRWVMNNMKSLLSRDLRKDFRFSTEGEEQDDDAVSIIINPLIIGNKALGVLRVDSPREGEYGQHELRILGIIGELAAVALENFRLYKQTEELAVRDSLTGLYVHRFFMERMEEEVRRALRSNTSFALLMLDIDNFKDFNDKYGHVSGDAILKSIGGILRGKTSPGDLVARYGGEEFAFLALGCNKDQAVELAEDIKKKVEKSSVVLRRERCSVTVSIGISVFPLDAKHREDMVWEADRCLYRAKAEGKNRVCSK